MPQSVRRRAATTLRYCEPVPAGTAPLLQGRKVGALDSVPAPHNLCSCREECRRTHLAAGWNSGCWPLAAPAATAAPPETPGPGPACSAVQAGRSRHSAGSNTAVATLQILSARICPGGHQRNRHGRHGLIQTRLRPMAPTSPCSSQTSCHPPPVLLPAPSNHKVWLHQQRASWLAGWRCLQGR